MSDIADKANDLMAMQTQIAIDRHRANTQQMVHTSPFCDECGEQIPAKRRQLLPNSPNCVDCQHIFEQQQRMQRR